MTAVQMPATAGAVVLVLHGGSADSTLPVGRLSLPALRLVPMARAVARSMPGAAVYRLRNSVRGWNGDGAAVLGDAQWALSLIQAEYPDVPIVVVGHSLGGRVAAHLAGSVGWVKEAGRVNEGGRVKEGAPVVGAVVLAPWLESSDPVSGLRGVPISVVQGTRDRTIPTSSTDIWLARASATGALMRRSVVDGGEHTMLRRRRRWDRLCVEGVGWVLETTQRSVTA
jgi:alpha-beta hydrolase superfamily lysophospholipase